ncbi:MAG: hypothetical protein HXK45_01320 [Atopobium sp.]|nr:hypothetical protein [Atopobium sp.]
MDFLEMVRMKGYKAFLSDMTTKHGDNTVYEVGKTYTVEGEVRICENGYHFCKKCVDVYDYYDKPCRICEVNVTGAVQTQGNKSVGRKLKILRELTADEISSLCNSGDRNSGNRNSGYCNTTEPTVRLFDHQTEITFSDFRQSRAYGLLRNIPSDCLIWKYSEYMTDDEKAEHPEHETTGGFLYLEKADRQAWWDSLSDDSKEAITSMPYFDADKFYKCTNIRAEK